MSSGSSDHGGPDAGITDIGATDADGTDVGRPDGRGPLAARIVLAMVVGVLAVVAFAGTLSGDFVWDDVHLVERNPNLDASHLADLLTADFGSMAASGSPSGLYRPVILLSYWFDSVLYGRDAQGYHITNLIVHALASMLLFGLALIGFGAGSRGVWCAWVVAALFAVHPLHTESVSWISGRTDVFAGAGLFAALVLYERGRRGNAPAYVGSLIAAMLALGSKETALVLPALLIVVEIIRPVAGRGVLTIARQIVPFVVLCGLLLWRLLSLKMTILEVDPIFPADATLATRVWTAATSLVLYAGKMFWPHTLNAEFETPVIREPGIVAIIGLIGVAVLVVAALLSIRRRPALTLGAALCLLLVLPALSLLVDIGERSAERYFYLPSAGFLIVLVALLPRRVSASGAGRAATTLCVVVPVLALLTWRTMERNEDWTSPLVFHEATASAAPDNKRARFKYAYALQERGRAWIEQRNFVRAEQYLEAAEAQYRAAVAIDPDYRDGLHGLGVVLLDLDRYDEAADVLADALRRHPDGPELAVNLGRAFYMADRLDEAFPLLVSAPEADAEMLYRSSRKYAAAGRKKEASQLLVRAVEIDPEHALALQALGVVYAESGPGMFGPASECFRRAIALDPSDARSMSNLAMLLVRAADPRLGSPDEAVALAERAIQIESNPHYYLILADVYYHLGHLPNCKAILLQGLALRPSDDRAFRMRLERIGEIEAAQENAGG